MFYHVDLFYHRYLEHRGTHKGNMKQDALYSERFDQIEQAFYLFGFTKAVSWKWKDGGWDRGRGEKEGGR